MEKKMLTDEISIKKAVAIGAKEYEELLEIETPGKAGELSNLWMKLVCAVYLAVPVIAVLIPVMYEDILHAAAPYNLDDCFRIKTIFMYLFAFIPVGIIAGLPHKLVFAFQNKFPASEARVRIRQDQNS